MKKAFIFPGQGSQFVGMGRNLSNEFKVAANVFAEVDEALNHKLSHIIFYGPEEKLTLTENAQPALMAVSMAIVKVMEKEFGISLKDQASFVAGHSLGEFSALAAANAISITEAAKILRIRGKAMQIAAPVGSGLMAAMIGCNLEEVNEIIAEVKSINDAESCFKDDQICQVANINCPGQIVISGHVQAIKDAIRIAGEKSKKAVALSVSAPFHSALMEPAKGPIIEALRNIQIKKPQISLVANVLASDITDPKEIEKALVEQVSGTVRWQESVEFMLSKGVTEFVSVGAGTVLAGLGKRIDRNAKFTSIQETADIEKFANEILEIA